MGEFTYNDLGKKLLDTNKIKSINVKTKADIKKNS